MGKKGNQHEHKCGEGDGEAPQKHVCRKTSFHLVLSRKRIIEPLNYLTPAGSLSSRPIEKKLQRQVRTLALALTDHPFRLPRLPATATAQLALRQYVLEIECTIVVESRNDDPDEVGDDFMSRLSELAPSGEHILGLSVQVLPIPELREALN